MKNRVIILFSFFVFILSTSSLVSQNVDSLKKALKLAPHDTVRVLICEQLSQASDLKVIREYSWMEYELCRKGLQQGGSLRNFYSNYFALAHNNIGFYFENVGQVDSARIHFEEYLKISEKEKRYEHVGTALNNLGVIMADLGDMKKAMEYYRRSYELGLKTNDKQTITVGLIKIAQMFNKQKQRDSALVYYKKAVDSQAGGKDKKTASQALLALGNQYTIMGMNKEAIEALQKSLEAAREALDDNEISSAAGFLGGIYFKQGDLRKALVCFQEQLSIREKINDKEGLAAAIANIGLVQKSLGYADKALEYAEKALKIQLEIHDMDGAANTYYNIGSIYYKLGDPKVLNDYAASYRSAIPKALEAYEKGLKIAEETKDVIGLANGYKHLGNIYTLKIEGAVDMRDNDKAIANYSKSLGYYEMLGDKQGVASILTNAAKVLFVKGKFSEAKEKGEKGFALAQELAYPEMIKNSTEFLTRVYQQEGNYKKALEMHILYKQMSDSTNSETSRKASLQKTFQFEYDKKVAADSVRTVQERKVHSLELDKERSQRMVLYGGLALLIAFSIFIYNRFKLSQKQKTIIEQKKKEVDTAYGLLHEKNKEVLDSIRYAKRIQDSFLPKEKYISGRVDKKP